MFVPNSVHPLAIVAIATINVAVTYVFFSFYKVYVYVFWTKEERVAKTCCKSRVSVA